MEGRKERCMRRVFHCNEALEAHDFSGWLCCCIISGCSVRTTGSGSTVSEYAAKVKSHIEELNVSQILDGIPLGNRLYQAQRTVEAMEKLSGQTANILNLTAHIHVCKSAAKCHPEKILTLGVLERQEALAVLKENDIRVPPLTMKILVSMAAQETKVRWSPKELDNFWAVVGLSSSEPKVFDVNKPLQSALPHLSSDAIKEVVQTIFIDDLLLPLLCDGAARAAAALETVVFLQQKRSSMDELDSPVLSAVLAEMDDILTITVVLLEPVRASDMKVVTLVNDFLGKTKQSDMKALVKKALLSGTRNGCYQSKVESFKSTAEKNLRYTPLVSEASRRLQASFSSVEDYPCLHEAVGH